MLHTENLEFSLDSPTINKDRPFHRRAAESAETAQRKISAQPLGSLRLGGERALGERACSLSSDSIRSNNRRQHEKNSQCPDDLHRSDFLGSRAISRARLGPDCSANCSP